MKFKQLIAVCLFGASALATANVSVEMFQMNRQMGGLLNAESVDEFQTSADKFIEFANKAKDKMPASLDEDKARFEGYQKSMQELIDTAAEAKALAAEGKLEEAKVVAKKLNQLKKIGHNEYK